ncbi:MAG TPA: carbonic anhydrase [Afifellaceae bacterium]|nr:carbonic anhydrase [Afifellaceae bacterium]
MNFPTGLHDGYRRFRAGRLEAERARYHQLAEAGQKPRVMVVGCCDSRAAPEIIFDARPGELFVVRNVANLVPPYAPDGDYHGTSAALEFAVQVLEVEVVLVLGHGRCGGIQAALSPGAPPLSPGDFIGRWMSLAERAAHLLEETGGGGEDRQTALERLSVRLSIDNLRSFPFIAERERTGRLTLHGAWFDIALGELWVLDGATGDYRPAW